MTLLPLLLLLALIGVLVAAQLLFGQRQLRRAEAQLQRHLQLWLLRRYGPPFEGQQPPQAAFVGALKSHRVLRTQTVLAQPDRQQSDYSLQANVIVQDEQRRFWLVLLELRLPSRSGEPCGTPSNRRSATRPRSVSPLLLMACEDSA